MTQSAKFVELSLVETADPEFVARVTQIYGRAVVEKILALGAEADLEMNAPDGTEFAAFAAGSGTRIWNSGVAYAHDLHRRGPSAAGAAILQLVLGFAQLGMTCRFNVDLPTSEWFVLQANRFRCVGTVIVDATAEKIEVTCPDESFSFQLTDGLWRPPGDTDPAVGWSRGQHYVYSSGYRVDPEVILAEDRALDSSQIAAAHRSVDAAIGHLERAGGRYLDWATRLISLLTLVSSEGGSRLSSRSVSGRTGNVEMAAPGNDQHLAELLIHEAAHQHYYLAQLFSPLVLPDAAGLRFYSAINGRERPLDRVALAYHAIVNIFSLLSTQTQASGEIADSSQQRLVELAFTERSLRETLTENHANLTPFGQEFCSAMVTSGLNLVTLHNLEVREFGRGAIRGVG